MKSGPLIIHEYFYEGGPDTFEYVFPIRDMAPDHEQRLTDWLRRFLHCVPQELESLFRRYLTEIATPEINPLLDLLARLTPYSIVIQDEDAWLLCKLPEEFSQQSNHQNMILLPGPNDLSDNCPELSNHSSAPLRHLLKHFAGTKIDIPPHAGFVWPEQWKPAIDDSETGLWENIQSWENSIPIYQPGNGDAVLVNSAGQFGKWDHEMTSPEFVERMIRIHGMTPPDDGDSAVFLIGGLAEFVEFLVADFGIPA